jgi:hypothetical protein
MILRVVVGDGETRHDSIGERLSVTVSLRAL